MKKSLMIAMALLMALGSVFAQTKTSGNELKPSGSVYSCPMHPDVVSDKPGKCPKCGMTLVKKVGGPVPAEKNAGAKQGSAKGMKKDSTSMRGMKM